MSISDFVNDQDNKPFHSSGYAEVSNSGSMSSTNTQSFGERHHIEHNRQHVRRYGDSFIATGMHARDEFQKMNSSREKTEPRHGRTAKPSPLKGRTNLPPQRHFSEPSQRYNPYA